MTTFEEGERICEAALARSRLRRHLLGGLSSRAILSRATEGLQPRTDRAAANVLFGDLTPIPQPARPAESKTMSYAEREFFAREQKRLQTERQNMQSPTRRFVPDPGPTTLADRVTQLRDHYIGEGMSYSAAHDRASSEAYRQIHGASFARDCALGRVAPAPAPAAPSVPAANDVSTLLTDRRDASQREFDALVAQGLTPERATQELFARSVARSSGTALRAHEQSVQLREATGAPAPKSINMNERIGELQRAGHTLEQATSLAFGEAAGVKVPAYPRQARYDQLLEQLGLCTKQSFTEQVEKEHPTWDGRRVSEEADRRWHTRLDALIKEFAKLDPSGQLHSSVQDKQRSEELASGLK